MSTLPSPKSVLAIVIACAFLLAGGALYLAIAEDDPVSLLFRHVLTIKLLGALVVWFAVAWAARRLIVGTLPKLQLGYAGVVWACFRIVLLIAVVMLMTGWLVALTFGFAVETAFLRATVLLVVVTAFTGVVGGAFMNSMLAVRYRRAQKVE